MFDMMERLLADLSTPAIEESFLAFELDLLREAGFMPELGICVSCGNRVGDRDGVYFSPRGAGSICGKCHGSIADRLPVDVRLLRLLRMIQTPAGNGLVRRLPRLTRHQTDPVNQLLLQHIEHSLGRRPKSAYYILAKKADARPKPQLTCNSAGQGA